MRCWYSNKLRLKMKIKIEKEIKKEGREMWSQSYCCRRAVGRNVAMKGGVRSRSDRRLGTRVFEPGGYKIELLLTNR